MRAPFPTALACLAMPLIVQAQTTPSAPRDGLHDFDAEHGTWDTHVRRLQRPLSGAGTWVEYRGTTKVTPLLDGRGNVAELRIAGDAGRIEGAALRIYQPGTGRWTIHFFNAADGELTAPLAGAFTGESARFEGDDMLGDRRIRVRFDIRRTAPDAWRFEQAFSADGGRTWEANWVAEDKRAADDKRATVPSGTKKDQVAVAEGVALRVIDTGPADRSPVAVPRRRRHDLRLAGRSGPHSHSMVAGGLDEMS